MVDFTTYQPPGVFAEEEVAPTVDVVGVSPTVIALVGPGVGYQTYTEAVVLTGTATTLLGKQGINTASVVVRAADGTAFAAGAYSLTVAAGADGNITITTDNTTTLARVGATIPDGSTVYVSYRFTDAEYTAPVRLRDYDDVVARFGPALDLTTNAILSPLSFAAKVAKENLAGEIVLVATPNATVTRADLTAAYARLEAEDDVDIVVPLPVGITGTTGSPGDTALIGQDLKTHLEASAALGLRKSGILGLESTVTVDPAATLASFKSKRVALVAPYSLAYYNGQTNSTFNVSGYYLAAGIAGIAANQAVQMPLTKKNVRGFAGITPTALTAMTLTTKNAWSKAGVMVVERIRGGALQIRHGATTDASSAQNREFSLVRGKDALVDLIEDTFEAASLVGDYIDALTTARVLGVLKGCLEQAVRQELILSYSSAKVRQREGDPQVIEVKFQYKPSYPLNYIVVSFSIDTQTGETTADLDLAA